MSVIDSGKGKRFEAYPVGVSVVPSNADPEKVVTIAVLEDGFTAFGQMWYRGQEITIVRGSQDWERTIDQDTGASWTEKDEDAQIEHFGKRMFKLGAWTGKGYDVDNPDLTAEQRAVLREAEEARRGGKVKSDSPPKLR